MWSSWPQGLVMVNRSNECYAIRIATRSVHLKNCLNSFPQRFDSLGSHPEAQEVRLLYTPTTFERVALHIELTEYSQNFVNDLKVIFK